MVTDAYCSWEEEGFTVAILQDGKEDLEQMELGDGIITLSSGVRYSILMVTREEISLIMDRHMVSGESLGGAYLAAPDLVIVRSKGVTNMIDVVRDIVNSGEIALLLPRIGEDGALDIPEM
ncbi:hypothetical protein AB0395_12955 [Streptosporangium sp. NPDC051023]|uniref:hypothetical protein n=1 Tax=Streptosporangium sp. NPDC051023 TaxID=3155410 RepID=UPI00344D5C78